MKMTPKAIMGPDTHTPAGRLVVGTSGSGKSYFIDKTLREYAKKAPEKWRGIIIDPKHEYDTGPIFTDPMKAVKKLDKHQIIVFYPDVNFVEPITDFFVDFMFQMSESDEEFSGTLVVEEMSMMVTPHQMPLSLKRIFTQGRSRRLAIVGASQRFLTNRVSDTQSKCCVIFRQSLPDYDVIKKRWGLDPENLSERLTEERFSFAAFDLEDSGLSFYRPLGSES